MSSRRSRSRIRASPSKSARPPKPGFHCLKLARILEVRDKTIIFDETFAPPVLVTHAHPVVAGWLERVIGWIDTKLETLARYAADPSSGGGLQTFDYFMLQMLNREINVLKHLRHSKYASSGASSTRSCCGSSGELWTFSPKRLAPEYPEYDHDSPEPVFEPRAGRHPAAAQPRYRPRDPART